MSQRTWVIIGATSIIAEGFAHLVASEGHLLRLVGRNAEQLDLILKDIQLRYKVPCEVVAMDMMHPKEALAAVLATSDKELDLFIAHSDFTDNAHLNPDSINTLIQVNILATIQLIHTYFNCKQDQHNLIYLSSVAACRGRSKNSLYGASKAAVEVYLQGLQQTASKNQRITIARLGFIDTHQTYGLPGIFYAAQPSACAKACLKALKKNKPLFYYPFFWRIIMGIISRLPFVIYKKMQGV
ncbi:MAG: SDR family NAD(P)-dependent oxidoreductase [Legionellales bacterium]